jgi:hypothetical protein
MSAQGPAKALRARLVSDGLEVVIEGVYAADGLPVTFLTPPVWKRAIGTPPGKDVQRTPRDRKQFAAGLDKPACSLASKTTDGPTP